MREKKERQELQRRKDACNRVERAALTKFPTGKEDIELTSAKKFDVKPP
mgnify:CR=1 FL=1